MKIKALGVGRIYIPLIKPFKTSIRTVESIGDVIVRIESDTGLVGFGEAPPTEAITGDTKNGIIRTIKDHIHRAIIGLDLQNLEAVLQAVDLSITGNTSSKAAVNIALYDLWGKMLGKPVYQLLGGFRKELITDITISIDEPQTMARDSAEAVKAGYSTLKIKVGSDSNYDIERIRAIREAVGFDVKLRIDANQAWHPQEAVHILSAMEKAGLDIELVEQPTPAHDLTGLRYVTENISIPVVADESVFSPHDALAIMERHAADMINIKLMKTGGLHKALQICALAELYGMECMMGCMLEGKVSVAAAVHLAAAKKIITKIDLDGPLLCKEDPTVGGPEFTASRILLNESPGFGIIEIRGVDWD